MLEELQRCNYSPEPTRGHTLAVKQFAECFVNLRKNGRGGGTPFPILSANEKKLAPGTVETRVAALRYRPTRADSF